ncbi:ABC-three component system protein [Paraburkholderia bannensis]|uniref:ABC-three component system protein n=1 Tax=Paraburkholderia bannensis TaxID=765414 RepID=UPI002AB6F969|nr:ABC-three component system protein [Paraburkholderia bannensis]
MIHQIFSSLPSFKNLGNLRLGLNVLLAQKTEGATSKQTRNRAGKTSFVELVHFLLGADAGTESIFRIPELVEHTFGMDFDLKSERTVVERSGSSKAKIFVTAPPAVKAKFSATEWCAFLGEQMFGLSRLEAAGSKPPSFRSLFAYFVRRQASGAFMTPEKQATMQGTGDMQMALMFLLGLDWQIARDWQAVRDREKTLEELKKAAGNGAFGSIIGKAADLRTELTIQEARLKKLHAEAESFHVLPEYRALEVESASLTRQLNELANANTVDFSAIRDLESALASEVPPDHEDLQAVYQEAGIVLPDLVKRRYEDVKSFHESVVRNRRDYLSSELEAANLRIDLRDGKKAQLDQRRGEILGILKSHGALEQFLKLQGELGRLESEVESLRQRFEAAEQLEGTKNELEIERNRLMIRLRRDFAEQKDRLAEAIVAFEETSQRLYESAGSMTIDETSNGPVFKFPMQGERSKGIKNMQIFCFDMMLMRLCAKRQMGPGFLIHDSHLFDGVDGRQVISALRLGSEIAQEVGFQYIVTMNEDDAFKEIIDGFDLNDHVIPTRLTDATEDGGLFGIRFG